MAKYFHIEAGSIDEGPKDLPLAWRHVSGLHLADATTLKNHGWLPQVLAGFEPFDPTTQIRTGPVNQVNADNVTSTYVIREKTQLELDASQREDDVRMLKNGGDSSTLVLIELVDYLLAHQTLGMQINDFSLKVRQAYLAAKEVVDRVKV